MIDKSREMAAEFVALANQQAAVLMTGDKLRKWLGMPTRTTATSF